MKTLLLIMLLGCSALAQDQGRYTLATDGKVAVQWHFRDEWRVWLSVNTYNGSEWKLEGYHPSYTYIRCQYRPEVKRMPDGQWQITFASEIAQDIP